MGTTRNKDYDPFKKAICDGDIAAVTNFLTDTPSLIHSIHTGGRSCLHYAAWANHQNNLSMIQLLLNKGAQPTLKDDEGWTTFLYALRQDEDPLLLEKIEILYNAAQNPKKLLCTGSNNNKAYPLLLAAQSQKNLSLLSWFLKKDPTVFHSNPTILHQVIMTRGAPCNIKIQAFNWFYENFSLHHSFFQPHKGYTLAQNAYTEDEKELLALIQKHQPQTIQSLNQWFITRQLVCIFGPNFLKRTRISLDENIALSAGASSYRSNEASIILSSALSEYIFNAPQIKKNKLLNIYNIIKQNCKANPPDEKKSDQIIEELVNQIKHPQDIVLISSSYTGHAFFISIENHGNDNFELCIFDLSSMDYTNFMFMQFVFQNFIQAPFIKKLSVKKIHLNDIIRKFMIEFPMADQELVEQQINNLPKELNLDTGYSLDKTQLHYVEPEFAEVNRCYWINTIEALQFFFVKELGKEGKVEFLKFIHFVEDKVIAKFKNELGNQVNPVAIQRLEATLRKKRKADENESLIYLQFWTILNILRWIISITALLIATAGIIFLSGASIPLLVPLFIKMAAIFGSNLHAAFALDFCIALNPRIDDFTKSLLSSLIHWISGTPLTKNNDREEKKSPSGILPKLSLLASKTPDSLPHTVKDAFSRLWPTPQTMTP